MNISTRKLKSCEKMEENNKNNTGVAYMIA